MIKLNRTKIRHLFLTIFFLAATFNLALAKKNEIPKMPAYQYPIEEINPTNANHWKWMKAFYKNEISQPLFLNETVEQATLRAAHVKPSAEKLAYLDMELITFPHFGMSTFSGHGQGTGKEDPRKFNPVAFDAKEWVKFHKAIGAKMIVFVAKHHDGYTLWPSKLNDYNVRNSPWRDGKGDMIKEIADACKEGGLKLGLYISLWDEHDPRCDHPRKGADKMTPEQRKAYQDYVEQQLMETLLPYGEISELWFDGAGTNGAEDWNRIFEIIHHFQPKSLVAMCGFGVRWCGNESAVGDAVNWNILPMLPELRTQSWVPYHFGQLISKKLPTVTDNVENLKGQDLFFIPQEGDLALLKKGWHWDGVGEPRSLEILVNTYYASIGSGANLIVSPAPDPTGVFNKQQLDRMVELRQWITNSFSTNLFKDAKITLTGGPANYKASNLFIEGNKKPYITKNQSKSLTLTAEFNGEQTFNNLLIQEYINEGQRISAFKLEAWKNGAWKVVTEGRTVGHKRILPFSEITSDKIRFSVTEARDMPALRNIGLYKALPYREKAKVYTEADYQPALADKPNLKQGLAWSYYEDANNGFLPYQEIFTYLNTTKVKPVATGFDVNPMKVVNSILKTQKRKEHFTVRFEGYFRAPAQAVYTFQAGANNGCRIYVDEKSVIENDASSGLPTGIKTADVPLQAGLHKLTVLYYFGTTGQPKLNLVVEWPGNAGGDGFGWNSYQRLLPLLWSEPSK
jgi:alpha-L-fucosidase